MRLTGGRAFLAFGVVAAAALAGCGSTPAGGAPTATSSAQLTALMDRMYADRAFLSAQGAMGWGPDPSGGQIRVLLRVYSAARAHRIVDRYAGDPVVVDPRSFPNAGPAPGRVDAAYPTATVSPSPSPSPRVGYPARHEQQ